MKNANYQQLLEKRINAAPDQLNFLLKLITDIIIVMFGTDTKEKGE